MRNQQDNKVDIVEAHIKQAAANDFLSAMVKVNAYFNNFKVSAYIAQTAVQKTVGLEIAAALEPNEGMLFPFEPPSHVTFHMGSVKFPIDILFLLQDDTDFRVAKIVHNVQPGSTTRWACTDTAAVLEVPAGTCKSVGIKADSVCQLRTSVSANTGINLV